MDPNTAGSIGTVDDGMHVLFTEGRVLPFLDTAAKLKARLLCKTAKDAVASWRKETEVVRAFNYPNAIRQWRACFNDAPLVLTGWTKTKPESGFPQTLLRRTLEKAQGVTDLTLWCFSFHSSSFGTGFQGIGFALRSLTIQNCFAKSTAVDVLAGCTGLERFELWAAPADLGSAFTMEPGTQYTNYEEFRSLSVNLTPVKDTLTSLVLRGDVVMVQPATLRACHKLHTLRADTLSSKLFERQDNPMLASIRVLEFGHCGKGGFPKEFSFVDLPQLERFTPRPAFTELRLLDTLKPNCELECNGLKGKPGSQGFAQARRAQTRAMVKELVKKPHPWLDSWRAVANKGKGLHAHIDAFGTRLVIGSEDVSGLSELPGKVTSGELQGVRTAAVKVWKGALTSDDWQYLPAHLTELELSLPRPGTCLEGLGRFTALDTLNLARCSFGSTAELAFLPALHTLRTLKLPCGCLTRSMAASFPQLRSLTIMCEVQATPPRTSGVAREPHVVAGSDRVHWSGLMGLQELFELQVAFQDREGIPGLVEWLEAPDLTMLPSKLVRLVIRGSDVAAAHAPSTRPPVEAGAGSSSGDSGSPSSSAAAFLWDQPVLEKLGLEASRVNVQQGLYNTDARWSVDGLCDYDGSPVTIHRYGRKDSVPQDFQLPV